MSFLIFFTLFSCQLSTIDSLNGHITLRYTFHFYWRLHDSRINSCMRFLCWCGLQLVVTDVQGSEFTFVKLWLYRCEHPANRNTDGTVFENVNLMGIIKLFDHMPSTSSVEYYISRKKCSITLTDCLWLLWCDLFISDIGPICWRKDLCSSTLRKIKNVPKHCCDLALFIEKRFLIHFYKPNSAKG